MGSRIHAVDIAWQPSSGAGSIDLEVRAGKGCLRKAGVKPEDVGILINAGVYRDRHIIEPAIASFIQRGIGANVGLNGTPGTFSFDLSNGGCGLLTAVMVADGFLQSGLTRHALVVAGDAEPRAGKSRDFAYAPAAAAVLLTPGAADEGFVAFRSDSDTSRLESHRGRVEWPGEQTESRLVLHSTPTYASECVDAAVAALRAFQGETGLGDEDIDLVVPSQSPPHFLVGLEDRTGLGDRIVDVTGIYGDVHTAGVGMALGRVLSDGRFAAARNVVFLTVGAGIATSLALYRVPR
jgi:3-oxoacyl-[acyl-carrier-protein] synthase-3